MPGNTLFAIVLAAGEASRFGATKQLAEFEGRPLVERAIRLAETACGSKTLLVVGCDWDNVARACAPIAGFLAINEDFAEGIGTSIACAAERLRDIADGLMVLLADQPLITPGHLQDLVNAWQRSPDSVVASAYAQTFGPPVILPRAIFPQLTRLRGDRGARKLIEEYRESAVFVSFEPAATDIDYPEDLTGS
jgi:molybdenum cofactor cytidylyltransferase